MIRDITTYPVGLGQLGDLLDKRLFDRPDRNEYVVQAGEKSVLKIASRRRAARLVTDATGLLDSQSAAPPPPAAPAGPSISRDPGIRPDPPEVP
jgi:hypothetical protein